MKLLNTLSFAFIFLFGYELQAQSIVWAKEFGTAGSGSSAGIDAASNSYITGVIGGAPGLFDDDTVAVNFSDIFIAKYDASGIVQWEKTMGNVLLDGGDDIYTDAAGNSYMVGYYRTNGIYPSINFDGVTLNGFGDADFYIAKYNSSGILQWVKNGGSPNGDFATGVVADNSGHIYICGFFNGNLSFSGATISSVGGISTDVFIAKLDVNGNLIWLQRKGGTGFDYAYDITADNSGNIALTGQFSGTINFDGITAVSSGIHDIYISKLNSDGNALWLKQAGSNQTVNTERGNNIVNDAAGNFYITGEFVKTASFGPYSLTANGPFTGDIFIAKYNAAGTVQWAHRGGGPDIDAANAVTIDNENNIFITGFADSGPGVTFDSIALPPLGNEYVYLAKYNSAGTIQFVNQYAPGAGMGLDANGSGCVTLTGYASGTTFGGVATPFVDRDGIIANFCEPVAGCDVPTGVFANNITTASAKTNWTAVAGAVKYKLQYRQVGVAAWTNKSSAVPTKKIIGLSPSTTYQYRVKTICDAGQSGFSPIQTFTTLPLRMDALNNEGEIMIFPNPSHGNFTIDVPGLNSGNYSFAFFNLEGKEILPVKMEMLNNGTLNVEVTNTPGIYFIRIWNCEETFTGKIIIE